MSLIEKLRLDLSWNEIEKKESPLTCNNIYLFFLLFYKVKSESYHAVFLIRLYNYFSKKKFLRLFRHYYSYRLKRRYSISLYDNVLIGGGLRLPHPYGIIFGNGVIIGKMVTIRQFVTLGGNFGETKKNRFSPIIGNWSMICANSVIAGPISIGEDVIVGACSLISKSIPDHSVVSTIGKLNIKTKDGRHKNSIVYNEYFNFSDKIIKNF